MALSAPKYIVWLIAVILGGAGIVGKFVSIQFVSANSFWLVAIGFIILVLATLFKDI